MVRIPLWISSVLVLCFGCGETRKASRRGAPDARAPARVAIDAQGVRPKIPQLRLGKACRCPGVSVKPGDSEALHQALVGRIDALNPGLRQLMLQLDRAVPSGRDVLKDPAPLRAAHGRLACGLDCLLSQFGDFTAEFWRYLRSVARFLDGVVPALRRLAKPPGERRTGPGPAALAGRFNEVVRRSNFTSGLTLLTVRPPSRRLELDARSFAVKSRGWRAEALQALRRFGTVAAQGVQGTPLGVRVAAARLLRSWRQLQARGRALVCARPKGCQAPMVVWGQTLAAATRVAAALLGLVKVVRGAPAGPDRARATQAVAAWDTAVRGFKTAAGRL